MNRTQLSLSDEWETQQDLFEKLSKKYNIKPMLDVAASRKNTKCSVWYDGLTDETDALKNDWCCYPPDGWPKVFVDTWLNGPHSKTKSFVLKAHEQWQKHNINILMLVPLQTLGRKYFNDIFDNYITPQKGVEWHRVQPRPTFIHPDQKESENAKQEYIVIIWRKRK